MTITFWFKRTGGFDKTVGLVSAGDAFKIQMTGEKNGQAISAKVNGEELSSAEATRHEWHFAAIRQGSAQTV